MPQSPDPNVSSTLNPHSIPLKYKSHEERKQSDSFSAEKSLYHSR